MDSKVESVRTLSLQNTKVSMENFAIEAEHIFPNLEELHLGFNEISILPVIDSKLLNLVTLNLEYNKLTDYSALSQLKKLENLNIQNNQISSVIYKSGDFPSLKFVNLSGNSIEQVKL